MFTIAWCLMGFSLLLFGVFREQPEIYVPWHIWPFVVLAFIELVQFVYRVVLPYL